MMIFTKTNDTPNSVKEVTLKNWSDLKKYYKQIHNIDDEYDIYRNESKIRIGKVRLDSWVTNSIFNYSEKDYIDAEIRYFRIQGAIYMEFMKNPHYYINTCAVRISKALNDFGIVIRKLEGMRNNAYIANGGTRDKPQKIIMNVKDMIDFLDINGSFGRATIFTPQSYHRTNIEFRKEVSLTINENGIVAMIVDGWGDAGGHIILWDKEEGFLDEDNYLQDTRNFTITKVYYWQCGQYINMQNKESK